jgi:hypothetical protein
VEKLRTKEVMAQGITLTGSRSTWLEAVGWDSDFGRERVYMWRVEFGDAEYSALRELARSTGCQRHCGHGIVLASGLLPMHSNLQPHGSVVFITDDRNTRLFSPEPYHKHRLALIAGDGL